MNISTAALAGGMARRFGADKTLAMLENKPLIQWVCEGAAQHSDDIMVISKNPAKYAFLENVRHVVDNYEQQCPLVGMLAAFSEAQHRYVFVISADMPLFPFDALPEMLEYAQDADVVIPEIRGKVYPCAAIYDKNRYDVFSKHYEAGDYRLTNVLKEMNVKTLNERFFEKYTDVENSFNNINTPEDLANAAVYRLKNRNEFK